MSPPGRQAIIILGMHRSGTSALAGALARLGFVTPRTPLDVSDDNPAGFYESMRVVMMNYEILKAEQAAWNLCFGIESAQLSAKLTPLLNQSLLDVLSDEFGSSGSFVLKDPRLCVLLPLWLPALRRMANSLHVLLLLRHPAEILQSHMVRNQRPADETLLNWLQHMLEAEHMSRDARRGILHYDDLLRDCRTTLGTALRRAAIVPPLTLAEAAPALDGFIATGLRHHVVADLGARIGPQHLAPLADITWRALCALARNPQDLLALAALDDARHNLAIIRRGLVQRGTRVVMPPVEQAQGFEPKRAP